MAKKKGGGGGSRRASAADGASVQGWLIAGACVVLAVLLAAFRSSGRGAKDDQEPPVNQHILMASMQKVSSGQPVTLLEIGQQLQFFCGDVLAGLQPGPPLGRPPADEKCGTYVKSLTRVAKSLEAAVPKHAEWFERDDALRMEKRLAAMQRLAVDFDALQSLVLHLEEWFEEDGGDRGLESASPLVPLLFQQLLHGEQQPAWEQRLTKCRRRLVLDVAAAEPGAVAFASALASQAALSDHAWKPPAGEEAVALAHLLREFELLEPQPGNEPARLRLAVVAAFRPLLPVVEEWQSLPAWRKAYQAERSREGPGWPFWQLWRLAVEEPLVEQELRARFAPGEAAAGSVRAMYEENPYPKWTSMTVELSWPAALFDWLAEKGWSPPAAWAGRGSGSGGKPKVLVAGCGTGKWLSHFARHFRNAVEIWAIDLSSASLAFAARKLREAGADGGVRMVRGDLLNLPAELTAEGPFDFIEVGGVLHHLPDPMGGWRNLVQLLRPGGAMLVALYSRIARDLHVNPCRDFARTGGFVASNPTSLREYRDAVFSKAQSGTRWAREIVESPDFASLSGLRDLCFHVQETQYTMIEIERMLSELDLRWVQMAETVSESKQGLFRKQQGVGPFSPEASPAKWHAFEGSHPTTFLGMYEFFVRSCGQGACDSS